MLTASGRRVSECPGLAGRADQLCSKEKAQAFGGNHSDVGARFARHRRLSETLRHAIASHHHHKPVPKVDPPSILAYLREHDQEIGADV
jgi:hypothetical protein